MKILIACEYSGIVRDAFIRKGHEAMSCDLLPTEQPGPHYQGNVLDIINDGFDMMIAHPPCTRLCNSGVRWLHERDLWEDLYEACDFYLKLRNAPIHKKAIENPIMHKYAKNLLGSVNRQIIKPSWFGEKTFKATGFELHNLPLLVPSNKIEEPEKNTDEYKKWSWVHRCSPGPNRWKIRSTTLKGIADAMAEQWG